MGKYLIGTCGYDYPEWKGVFYPPTLKRADFLSFYATQFNALEINYTYYKLPLAENLSRMVQQTGNQVVYSIKGNQEFTHHIEIGKWKDVVRQYRDALYPMVNAGVLSSVLLEFPQSFHYQPDNRQYLSSLIKELEDLPLVVEFRHSSWQRQSVYDGLLERGIGWCMCDMPNISKLPSFAPIVTSGISYMRFHGQNAENWYGTDSRSRYDYLYKPEELEKYKAIFAEVSKKTQIVQIFFNNHAKGSAAVNARTLMSLLA